MPRSTIASSLLACGLVVGVAATVALLFGFEPTRLSPFLVKIALFKLTFIAAIGLIAAGALLGRRARNPRRDTTRMR
ncbi:MAG: hypothetical protein ABIV10_01965 [Gemmatimonadaceae bacterium]